MQIWLQTAEINNTVKALDVKTENENFSENTYNENKDENKDESENETDKSSDSANISQRECSESENFHMQIYKEATSYLKALMKNSEDKKKSSDTTAKAELEKLNQKIKKHNIKNKLSEEQLENFFINIAHFIDNFQLIKSFIETLKEDSADDDTRKEIEKINKSLNKLNELKSYSQEWLIQSSLK